VRGLSWIRDPITTKELSGLARGWQPYAARGLYIGLFGIVVWTYVSGISSQERLWLSQSTLANLGQKVVITFLPLQMGLVILTAISSASDLVTKELRMGTLGLLVCTPLTPWRVALGKWRAAVLQSLTLLFSGVPILGACSALGGVTPRDIVAILTLSAAGASLGAAIALLCSSLFRSATTSLLVATGLFVAYLLLPVLASENGRQYSLEFALLGYLHVLPALVALLIPQGRIDAPEAWISAAVVTGGLSLLLLRVTAARLTALTVRTPAPPLLTRTFDRLDRFYEGFGPERFRQVRLFSGSSGVWDQRAILWKELKTRASGRLRNSVRIAVGFLVILSLFMSDLTTVEYAAWVTTVLLWFMALANGASLFVTEKEERKWDLLLVTPLRSADILTAKLLAGIVPVLPMVATVWCFWAVQVGVGMLRSGEVLLVIAAVGLPALAAYLAGAAASLKARSLRAAFTLALSAMTALILFVPWLIQELAPRLDLPVLASLDEDVHRPWIDRVGMLREVNDHGWRRWTNSDTRHPEVFSFGLAYLVLSGSILAYLYRRFNRVTGRSE